MPREYDTQLIESVGVRRRRLRDAWLFGADRTRHAMDEYVGKMFGGVALAAVICAGCVGWALVEKELAKEKQKQGPTPPSVSSSAPASATPTGPIDVPSRFPTGTTSSR